MDSIIHLLLIIALFAFFDSLPQFFLRFSKAKAIPVGKEWSEDYTILVSVFFNPSYLKDLEKLEKYSKHVLILTTNNESKEFYEKLDWYCKKYGYRQKKLQFDKDFVVPESCIPLFTKGIDYVDTKYLIRMDADSIPEKNLRYLFGAVEKHNLDLASIRVHPLPEQANGNIWERIQTIEYENSMNTRVIFPFITSGAAIIGKTDFLKKVARNHSGFFNGEDIEIGKLSRMLKGKIGHIKFNVYTEIPSTFKKWFRQRTNWMMGGFRHSVINFWTNSPWHFFYYTIVVYGFLPFRLYYAIVFFYFLPLIKSMYILVNFIFRYKTFDYHYFIFPFYAFIQSTLIPPISIVRYFFRVIKLKNIGIIRVRYKEDLKIA